ncbi:hypothetical protein R1flu_005335 [Riccia fluitans]|uniref:SAP domain-containing protein n=1 Tax=Riccia fluitans TaxID=41844 RepID=A0ABD1YSW2_9MARC
MLLHFVLLYFCYSYCVCTEPLVVYVDCRFDSSRSGYHGTLPIINVEDDRVIDMVTLTRKQVGSSWKIETAALEQALTLLESKGLAIAEVIHDDNTQLKDYCRDNGLQQTGSKLQLVQRVTVHLKLPEASANTENQGNTTLQLLTLDIHNAANHWAGDHSTCRILPGVRKCVTENWSAGQLCKYPEAMDWNENIRKEVRAVYHRVSNNTAVRHRAKTNKALVDRTSVWKTALANRVFI